MEQSELLAILKAPAPYAGQNRNLPAGWKAAGAPCRVLRPVGPGDRPASEQLAF